MNVNDKYWRAVSRVSWDDETIYLSVSFHRFCSISTTLVNVEFPYNKFIFIVVREHVILRY